jgi:RimJ/RimL family protein N-acetyltransferase
MTGDLPTPADARIMTGRLELAPVTADDAEPMSDVANDQRLYEFIGGGPATVEERRAAFERLAAARSADQGNTAQRNWVVRRRAGDTAEVASIIGVPWQGQGLASEANLAVVDWLDARGVRVIIARIHPHHRAAEAVAIKAGFQPTGDYHDQLQIWRRRRR